MNMVKLQCKNSLLSSTKSTGCACVLLFAATSAQLVTANPEYENSETSLDYGIAIDDYSTQSAIPAEVNFAQYYESQYDQNNTLTDWMLNQVNGAISSVGRFFGISNLNESDLDDADFIIQLKPSPVRTELQVEYRF